MTLGQLTNRYCHGKDWVRKQLQAYQPTALIINPRTITLIIDVTYFGHSFGVLVAMEADTGIVVYYAWLNSTEKTSDYEAAIDTLEGLGYLVQAVIIDGRKGVRQALLAREILVQHCQFHQLQTITQCLTRRPQLIQNQQLRAISLSLVRTTEREFRSALITWHDQHGDWLKERYYDESNRLRYRHARTRRAYFSLRRNLPYLFIHQLQPETNAVPNTTNRLDGQFGVWKMALKRHRGCSKQLKTKILCSFFSRTTDKLSN